MRLTKLIPISLIKMDRYPINRSTLKLIDYIRTGGEIPPIKIVKLKNGNYEIRDGRHRVTAYKMLGIELIKARFSNECLINNDI